MLALLLVELLGINEFYAVTIARVDFFELLQKLIYKYRSGVNNQLMTISLEE